MEYCDIIDNLQLRNTMKKASAPLIRKRKNDLENEVRKVQKEESDETNPIPPFYGDRFIPRRYCNNSLNRLFNTQINQSKKMVDPIQAIRSGYWRSGNYGIALNNALSLQKERVLRLSDPMVLPQGYSSIEFTPKCITIERPYSNIQRLDWPCIPRPKPLAFPDSTHDLPGFTFNSEFNTMSWSKKGLIAASFGNDIVLWNPVANRTFIYKTSHSRAIAFSPNGNLLAVSCEKNEKPALEIWDVSEMSLIHHMEEHVFESKRNVVNSIDWDSTMNFIACGTKKGEIFIFTLSPFKVLKRKKQRKISINFIKFSPKLRYFVTSDVTGNIYVWNFLYMKVYVRLISQRKCDIKLAWHPWNDTDLVIAEDLPASIVVVNIPSKLIVAHYQRNDQRCQIDSITFSPLSGELLVSYTIRNLNGCLSSETLVMASLDRVVDVLRMHDDCIRYMLWSPDGTQLATAGDDDALTIWNFFSTRKSSILKRQEKYLEKQWLPRQGLQGFKSSMPMR